MSWFLLGGRHILFICGVWAFKKLGNFHIHTTGLSAACPARNSENLCFSWACPSLRLNLSYVELTLSTQELTLVFGISLPHFASVNHGTEAPPSVCVWYGRLAIWLFPDFQIFTVFQRDYLVIMCKARAFKLFFVFLKWAFGLYTSVGEEGPRISYLAILLVSLLWRLHPDMQ